MFSGVGKQMVNAEFSRIYRFVKLLVNEGFLAVYIINWRDATQFDSEDHYRTGFRDVSHWHASVQLMFSKEKCESLPGPLCNRRFIQYARIPACWINCPFYKIRAKVIFHRCCYLRYRLLMSPYSWGLHDLRVQCVAVLSIYSLTLVLSRLW